MNDLIEIRWYGRGGQGAKTALLLLADAAFNTAFILFLPLIGYGVPTFPHCLFNLLGDTSAHGGSACTDRMLRMRKAADGLRFGRASPG